MATEVLACHDSVQFAIDRMAQEGPSCSFFDEMASKRIQNELKDLQKDFHAVQQRASLPLPQATELPPSQSPQAVHPPPPARAASYSPDPFGFLLGVRLYKLLFPLDS